MNSLEKRLGIGLLVSLLVTFALLLWGAGVTVRSLSEAYMQTRLEHDAEALVAAYSRNPRGKLMVRQGRITPIYQQPLSGHYYALLTDDGMLLKSRSLWDESLDVTPLPPGSSLLDERDGPAKQLLLVRTAGYEKNGLRFTLAVAEDLTPMNRHIVHFQLVAAALLTLALLVVVSIQRLVLRRGFASLDQVRQELKQVAAGNHAKVEHLGPSEIRPLTLELNRLLPQIQKRLQRSRESLGNLAHAIKSPLSLATHDVEQLPIDAQDKTRLLSYLQQIQSMTERELKRARLAVEVAGQRFFAERDVPELFAALQQLYRERDLSLTHGQLPAGSLPLDNQDAMEMLGNLLDNACKWAAKNVHLEILAGQELVFRVSDDGPGVPESQLGELLKRGARLDEQRCGHGLGLAIVEDLVEEYGGHLVITRSASLGGLEVRVDLPLEKHPSVKEFSESFQLRGVTSQSRD